MSRLNFVIVRALAAVALVGCSEHIALGSECGESPCAMPSERDAFTPTLKSDGGALDAARSMEAGSTPPVDSKAPTPPPDASSEPQEPTYPGFTNPSFDLIQGGPGDITTVNSVLPDGTLIAPWYTCQPIGGGNTGLTAVRAETSVERLAPDAGVAELIMPSDGVSMVSIAHLANALFPLFQELGEPLAKGKRYAVTIDVRALSEQPEVWLEAWGADGCRPEELLDWSEPAAVGSWQTVCFDFVPEEAHRLMLLQAKSMNALGERLLFDNVRPTPGCPPDP